MKGALPFVAMVVVQVTQVGLTIASKKAIETGMHNFSYIFYSNALSSLILLPAVFIVHRPLNRPALTFLVAGWILVLDIIGLMAQVFGYAGVTYASTTEATSIANLVPGFTFLLGVIFRLERLDYGGGLAKLIGTLVSALGALIVTFYAGPAIIMSGLSSISPHLLGESSDLILGGVLLLIGSILAALCIIVQALVLKKYPAVLILVLVYCSFTAVISLLSSLILERDLNAFNVQSKTRLLAILYSGLFGGGFQVSVISWCIKMKGPLFVAMFQPLAIVIAAIIGVMFLGDGLYLGTLLGSGVIAIGFYAVMWGMAKEDKIVEVESSKSPLLLHDVEEDNFVQP